MSYDIPDTTFEEINLEKDPTTGIYVVVIGPHVLPKPELRRLILKPLVPMSATQLRRELESLFEHHDRWIDLEPVGSRSSMPAPKKKRQHPWLASWENDGGPILWLMGLAAIGFWLLLFLW